jgi:hypothetical protein
MVERISAYSIPAWHAGESEEMRCTLPSVQGKGYLTIDSVRNKMYFNIEVTVAENAEETLARMHAAVFKMLVTHFGSHVSQILWLRQGD